MADSAMVSAYFFAQKIEDFHPRFLSETFFTITFNLIIRVLFQALTENPQVY